MLSGGNFWRVAAVAAIVAVLLSIMLTFTLGWAEIAIIAVLAATAIIIAVRLTR